MENDTKTAKPPAVGLDAFDEAGPAPARMAPQSSANGPRTGAGAEDGCEAVFGAGGACAAPQADPWLAEVRSLPAAALAGLPVPTTLRLTVDGLPVVVTSSRAVYAAARADGLPALVGRELAAVAAGAINDRLCSRGLRELLERKRCGTIAVITREMTLAGLPESATVERPATIGEALDALGVELVAVELYQ